MTKRNNEDRDAQWSPRDGYDWGEGTSQGRELLDDDEPAPDWWSDAYEIRMRYGIPAFDPEVFDYEVYVDRLIHEKPAERTSSAGGTDWVKIGERGCGKSTDNLHWACRLMEENGEKVVWRGATSRSEWLPFAPWATLWLPKNAEVSARWAYGADGRGSDPIDVEELEDQVREVRYYDDVLDQVDGLVDAPAGTFHVVYPDPSFSGCEELTRRTDRTAETLPFVPEWRAMGDTSGTPLTHWWFAWMLARTEFADNSSWTSLMFDEMGELVPPNAEQDEHRTYAKLLLFRSCMIDSRRERLSLFGTIHRESQAHWMILEEFMTRVDMPDGTPNPRKNASSSIPQGFETVPMYADVMSDRQVGTALMYSQDEFTLYRWSDLKSKAYDDDRVLKLEFSEPEAHADEAAEDAGPSLEYDTAIFNRWRGGPDKDRLYVKDPGDGYLDVLTGQEIEPLVSPRPSLKFGGISEDAEAGVLEVTMRPDGDVDDSAIESDVDEIVVARIPIKQVGIDGFDVDDSAGNSGVNA